jgi:hypothetical protein
MNCAKNTVRGGSPLITLKFAPILDMGSIGLKLQQ